MKRREEGSVKGFPNEVSACCEPSGLRNYCADHLLMSMTTAIEEPLSVLRMCRNSADCLPKLDVLRNKMIHFKMQVQRKAVVISTNSIRHVLLINTVGLHPSYMPVGFREIALTQNLWWAAVQLKSNCLFLCPTPSSLKLERSIFPQFLGAQWTLSYHSFYPSSSHLFLLELHTTLVAQKVKNPLAIQETQV